MFGCTNLFLIIITIVFQIIRMELNNINERFLVGHGSSTFNSKVTSSVTATTLEGKPSAISIPAKTKNMNPCKLCKKLKRKVCVLFVRMNT